MRKEFIDEMLGLQQTGFTTINGVKLATYRVITHKTGYGNDVTWNGASISEKPNPTHNFMNSYQFGLVPVVGKYPAGHTDWVNILSLPKLPTVGDVVIFGGIKALWYKVTAVKSIDQVKFDTPLGLDVTAKTRAEFYHLPYMDYRDNPNRPGPAD